MKKIDPVEFTRHLLDVSKVPINDILESTGIPEDIFLRDFIEAVLSVSDPEDEFKNSVWQIPQENLTEGVSLEEETERIRQILITWAELYVTELFDLLYDLYLLADSEIEKITEVKLIDNTHLLIEIESLVDEH